VALGVVALGVVALGATALGATALGTTALGAAALGVVAFGVVALGVVALGTTALGAAALGAMPLDAAELCATVVGGAALGALGVAAGTSALELACLAAGAVGARSSMVVITAPGCVDASAGEVDGIGTDDLFDRMAPNTATHITITSAHAIAARRMADLPRLGLTDGREPRCARLPLVLHF
jgi:hypothetical protein